MENDGNNNKDRVVKLGNLKIVIKETNGGCEWVKEIIKGREIHIFADEPEETARQTREMFGGILKL